MTKLNHFKKLGTKLNQKFNCDTKLKITITIITCHDCKLSRDTMIN